MTTKQAEEINNKFLRMQDSIKLLRTKIEFVTTEHKIAVDSLVKTSTNLNYQTNDAIWYKREYNNSTKEIYKMAKEQNSNVLGILVACALFTTYIFFHGAK